MCVLSATWSININQLLFCASLGSFTQPGRYMWTCIMSQHVDSVQAASHTFIFLSLYTAAENNAEDDPRAWACQSPAAPRRRDGRLPSASIVSACLPQPRPRPRRRQRPWWTAPASHRCRAHSYKRQPEAVPASSPLLQRNYSNWWATWSSPQWPRQGQLRCLIVLQLVGVWVCCVFFFIARPRHGGSRWAPGRGAVFLAVTHYWAQHVCASARVRNVSSASPTRREPVGPRPRGRVPCGNSLLSSTCMCLSPCA